MGSSLPADPFGRSRLPATFDRAGRVALLAECAEALLRGELPRAEARLFLASALRGWLRNGGRLGALERDTIEQAVRFMRTVLRHAFALYLGLLTSSQSFEVARAVARSLVADARRPEKVGRDYMTQACRPFRAADDGTRRLAVQALEDAEWLKPVPGSRAYGGWGASEWAVNPRAFDQFADQGAAHRARRDAVRALLAGGHDGA